MGAAADLVFLCRPVIWEADSKPLTWQGQLSGQDLSTILDPATGGRRLQVFRPAIYKCFVHQELVARFNPRPHEDPIEVLQREEARQQREAEEAQQEKRGHFLRHGLKLLLVGTVLSLLGMLLKLSCPSRSKRRKQVLLVK